MTEYCIGTAQFGMPYGIANQSGQPRQGEIDRIVQCAVGSGIQYFDTAQSYGNSESVLGKSVGKLVGDKDIKFISKLSPDLDQHNASEIISSVKNSLLKLNVKNLYGFLAHRAGVIETKSFSRAINKLKDDGLIKKCGVSVYTPEEAHIALNNQIVEILQIPFNIIDRRWIDQKIIEKARENSIQLFFRSIFLQGLLFLDLFELQKRKMNWAWPYLEQFNKMVKDTSFTPMELTFNLLSNISINNVIIIGVDNVIQLKNNVNCIKNIKYDDTLYNVWWDSLPSFPERLLNPALW